jgi:3-hydroxyacyl-[acyl-carrier-protein] dehydratase
VRDREGDLFGAELMDAFAIRDMLPHRYPFLLVDRITAMQLGSSCVGEKNITWNEPCYADVQDDADTYALRYPVHLLIESFAQAGAILCLASMKTIDVNEEFVMLAGSVRGMKIYDDVFPGDVLVSNVSIARQFSDTVVLEGSIKKKIFGQSPPIDVAEIESVVVAIRPKAALLASMATQNV